MTKKWTPQQTGWETDFNPFKVTNFDSRRTALNKKENSGPNF